MSTASPPSASAARRRAALPWLVGCALLGTLVVLALLQYRWLGEVRQAEQERLRASIRRDAQQAADAIDTELTELLLGLVPGFRTDPASTIRRWRAGARSPDLLGDVLLVTVPSQPGPRRRQPDDLVLEEFDEEEGRFHRIRPRVDLRPVVAFVLEARLEEARGPRTRLEPSQPALVHLLDAGRRGTRGGEPRFSALVLRLDRSALADLATDRIFPQLRSSLGADFTFRLVDAAGVEVAPWDAPPPQGAERLRFDVLAPLPPEELDLEQREELARRLGRELPPAFRRPRPDTATAPRRPAPEGAWTLEIAHRDGSLARAVASAHRRNLFVNGAILALLGAAAVALIRSAARDRELARRQVDFVAGLTHELHTPLAAITSAGANLADGVVRDPQRVRQYGELLQREGRRLDELVGQALELAGMESSRPAPSPRVIDTGDLLRTAAARCRLQAEQAGASLVVDSDTDTGSTAGGGITVLVERESILRALTNLVSNAIKVGASQVRLGAARRGGAVAVTIADDGPGIAADDVPGLFEPWVRGRRATGPGSGLGLHLARRIVEQQGGRLRLVTPGRGDSARGEDRGAVFEVELPAAEDAAQPSTGEDPP